MSYIINKTDGTVLTEIVDGTIDQTATDLTLIGKNASNYGEFYNENLVKLLENFASTTAPNNPIAGQLWFDTTENRLKIYDGSGFRVSGGTIVASSAPSGLVQGDIWIDSTRKQLYFYDGTQLTLAGPPYTNQQGLTGLTIESVLDTNQFSRTVALLYVNQVLIGIFSKDEFTPSTTIPGYSGRIYPGFNAGSTSDFEFRTTATTAKQLVNTVGDIFTPEDFITTTADTAITGKFSILNPIPLVLGASQQTEIRSSNTEFNIISNVSGQDFTVKTKNVGGLSSAIMVKATDQRVGIFTDSPEATLDVNGSVVIQGDLTVKGDSTTVNTSILEVEDKHIELGKIEVPTDTLADGGGIILKGTTDHSITWNNNGSSSNWTSTEHVNLVTGKTFKVNNIAVLSATSLGNTVESAPGLRSLGILYSLSVDNINVDGNTISSLDTNGNIVLSPNGIGTVDVDTSRIVNLSEAVDPTDAVNLQQMTDSINATPKAVALDITSLSPTTPLLYTQIATILGDMYPPADLDDGATCRVYGTRQTVTYSAITLTHGTVGSENITYGRTTVDKGGVQEVQSVIQDIATNPVDAGDAVITYTRHLYEFITNAGAWEFNQALTPTALPT